MKVYGIPNCDTVKKTLKLLESLGHEFEFVNFKKSAPQKSDISRWKKSFGDWPVNKRGRTFKQLKEEFESASDAAKVNLIIENTSLIKRPIIEAENTKIIFGFSEDEIRSL